MSFVTSVSTPGRAHLVQAGVRAQSAWTGPHGQTKYIGNTVVVHAPLL